jgi:dihydrofolate reductase
MSEVVLSMQVSLDGYVATLDGSLNWVFRNFSDELTDANVKAIATFDTVLMGRHNYLEQAAAWSEATGPIADIMNAVEKVVFSNSLSEPLSWRNSRLATGTPEDEIRALGRRGVETIGVPGGAAFAQQLADRDLINQYRLVIHPIALGSGFPLFRKPTPLASNGTEQYPHGVVVRRFRPIRSSARKTSDL